MLLCVSWKVIFLWALAENERKHLEWGDYNATYLKERWYARLRCSLQIMLQTIGIFML